MQAKVIHEAPQRTFALVLDKGDEVVAELQRFALEHGLVAAQLTGLGAFSRAVLGYFDWECKAYVHIPVEEQVEVVTLVGDFALHERVPKLHAHVVLGRRDGQALGGHLLEGHVRPTLEVIVTDSPSYLRRVTDRESGLALIRTSA